MLKLLLLLALPAAAQAPQPGVFTIGPARFTVMAPECVRIEYSTAGVFVDDPSLFAAGRASRFLSYSVAQSPKRLVLDTGRIRLTYTPDGWPLSVANLKAEVRVGTSTVVWTPERYDERNLGGTRNLDGVKGPAPMAQGLLSREGWHVVDDSESIILKEGWPVRRPAGHGTDWYLFGYGLDYKAALRALAAVGGQVPLPRKYALGSWYSRWWPHSAADYRRIVKEYREHGFPLDVLVLDMDWHKGGDWTGYSWDRKLFPEPKAFLDWAHKQGLFVALNEHPQHCETKDGTPIRGGVQPFEDRYVPFMRAMGQDPAQKKTLPFDAGSRKYLETFYKYTHEPLEDQGVDLWWLDYWSEDPKFPFNRLAWLNEYWFQRSQRRGQRGLCFSRWGDWGDQRHPMLFSGDAFILWPTLAFEVPFTAGSAGTGAFFWSHDIGGYQGGRDGELLARWTQFGAFSAALRLHSMNKPDLDKRPWSYPREIEESMKASFRLRSILMPYTYSAAWQAHSESLPLLRPMYLEYPREEEAYRNPQEYLYGDSLLVAPIVSTSSRQQVWFPEGDWYDWFTGEKFTGPAGKEVSKGLDSFPLYAKAGAPIVMQPFTERMGTEPLKTLVLRCYPGPELETMRATLYEDDGLSRDYLSGGRALTEVSCLRQGERIRVIVGAAQGSYKGQSASRQVVVEIPTAAKADRALLERRDLKVEFSASERLSRVRLPAADIRKEQTLYIWLP